VVLRFRAGIKATGADWEVTGKSAVSVSSILLGQRPKISGGTGFGKEAVKKN
jgi:hypothetical protein